MSDRRGQRPVTADSLLTDDESDSGLLQSPAKAQSQQGKSIGIEQSPLPRVAQSTSDHNVQSPEAREENLRRELASVRKVNEAIEGVLESLEKAKKNMKTVNSTVGSASSLLNTWTRILSQTEHNQRLILDPSWQGASQDLEDIEEEEVTRKQASERREAEEQERRATAARKAEEEERRRIEAATTSKPKTTARGKAAGLSRSSSTGKSGYLAGGTTANTSSSSIVRGTTNSRRGSNIGRATSTRGRGRP